MAFEGMDCSKGIASLDADLQQKLIIANMTADFLLSPSSGGSSSDGTSLLFEIQSLEVVAVAGCSSGAYNATNSSRRQLQNNVLDGIMELTMDLQALIIVAATNNSTFDLQAHIYAQFNNAEAVHQFLADVRANEELTTFASVDDLQVVEVILVLESSAVPSVGPSQNRNASEQPAIIIVTSAPSVAALVTTTTDAPVIVSASSPAAMAPNNATSAAASSVLYVVLSRVMLLYMSSGVIVGLVVL